MRTRRSPGPRAKRTPATLLRCKPGCESTSSKLRLLFVFGQVAPAADVEAASEQPSIDTWAIWTTNISAAARP